MAKRYVYDHEWLDGLIAAEVKKQKGDPVGTVVAHGVALEVEDAVARGQREAAPVQRALVEHSLIQIVEAHLRRQSLGVTVGWNGSTISVSVPARLGHPTDVPNQKTGLLDRVVQYPLWLDAPWDVLAGLRERTANRRDGMDQQLLAFDKLLALRPKYPNASPRQAALLEGLDLDTFAKVIP